MTSTSSCTSVLCGCHLTQLHGRIAEESYEEIRNYAEEVRKYHWVKSLKKKKWFQPKKGTDVFEKLLGVDRNDPKY